MCVKYLELCQSGYITAIWDPKTSCTLIKNAERWLNSNEPWGYYNSKLDYDESTIRNNMTKDKHLIVHSTICVCLQNKIEIRWWLWIVISLHLAVNKYPLWGSPFYVDVPWFICDQLLIPSYLGLVGIQSHLHTSLFSKYACWLEQM